MRPRVRAETLWDIAVLAGGFALTIGFCLHYAAHHIFWSDELFGWMLLRDPSFRHMIEAWRAGADGGGLLFYLLGRGWFFLFGPSEMSFRLFSAVGVFLGFAAVWMALRRQYARWLLAPLLFAVWFAPFETLFFVIEGRFYGLLLGAAGLAFWSTVRLTEAERPGARLLWSAFAAHLLLVGTHPLGAVYSAALLVALLMSDALSRRLRPEVYLSVAAGWSVLLVSREAMQNSAKVGKPHFWTVRPHVRDLRVAYTESSSVLLGLLVCGALLILAALIFRRLRAERVRSDLASHAAALLAAFALLLVPALIWVASQSGTSLFVDRYLLPVDIGLLVLQAELWSLALVAPQWPRLWRRMVAGAIVVFCAGGVAKRVVRYREVMFYPPDDYTGALVERLPEGVPTVFESVDMFDLMLRYRGTPSKPMMYLLDWETAMAPESPRGDVSGYHEMENWRKLGYFSGSIADSDRFLATTRDFVVVDDAKERWFERRIENDPQWEITSMGAFVPPATSEAQQTAWGAKLWRIHRRD